MKTFQEIVHIKDTKLIFEWVKTGNLSHTVFAEWFELQQNMMFNNGFIEGAKQQKQMSKMLQGH